MLVTEPIDGTRRRKRREPEKQRRPRLEHRVVVHPAVMAAAKAALRPGQRLEIVSATEVRLVNE